MRLFLTLSALLFVGCSTMERKVSGKIGCHYDNVEIYGADSLLGLSDSVFNAKCGNSSRVYICSNDSNTGELSCARTASLKDYPTELFSDREGGFEDFVNDLNEKADKSKAEGSTTL